MTEKRVIGVLRMEEIYRMLGKEEMQYRILRMEDTGCWCEEKCKPYRMLGKGEMQYRILKTEDTGCSGGERCKLEDALEMRNIR